MLKFITQIGHIDQKKSAWFVSDFCGSCATYIYATNNRQQLFFELWEFAKISLMWLHLKSCLADLNSYEVNIAECNFVFGTITIILASD